MSYFSDNSIDEEKRRNDAFKILSGLREALTIAKRGQQPVPYKKTLDLIYDINPDLHNDVRVLLTKRNESEIVKYYKQKAELLRSENPNSEVTPESLLEQDIEAERRLLQLGDNASLIRKRIFELESALEHFQPEDISENFLLNHDFTLDSRHKFFQKKIYETAKVKDYSLPGNRILRLRLLHPDKAERIIGSDLVYEQFDIETQRVRFVHLQYKTWNTNVLYFNQGNLVDQLDKLEKNICQAGYCFGYDNSKYSENYRFPYCSAFLRPTSYLTKPDSTLTSTGIHIPVCMAKQIQSQDVKLDKKNSKGKYVGHNIFEELFIAQHLGSRWLTFDQLEEFYRAKGITAETGRIRVHAQEVFFQSEEDRQQGKRRL